MPIYKIPRRGSPDQRAQDRYSRLRLVAVLISCLLLSVTAALLLYGGR